MQRRPAGLDAERSDAPTALTSERLAEYRDAHPLSRVFPLLYDVLGRAAEECDSLMADGDSDGRLLWVCGRPAMLALGDTINFAEGTAWDEPRAGTNAPVTQTVLGVVDVTAPM